MGVRGDFDKLRKFIKNWDAIAKGSVQQAILRGASFEILDRVHEGFSQSHDPFGNPWADLKWRSGQPLRLTGRLMNSFQADIKGLRLMVRTNVDYFPHHQWGAPRANIPARPMLPPAGTLPPAWAEAIAEIAREELKRAGIT